MNSIELKTKLEELLGLPAETEWLEIKEAKTSYDVDKLGRYFSALSNEANLRNLPSAWLVFGVSNKKTIVGSTFRNNRKLLDNLKGEVSAHTAFGISFSEIYEVDYGGKRVILFQIPPALKGIPTPWKGHLYGRDGENLVPLSEEKRERIRRQSTEEDWSKAFCPDATIEDLDPIAILKARENYRNKFPGKATEVDQWNDVTFLNKAKLTVSGKITRTAIILLGREESEHFVSSADIKIRWVLKDSSGSEIDYQIETCPFILAVDKIYSKIRNLRYRYIRNGSLFPEEVDRYEPFVIREAINNCIAHQDYSLGARINVVEGEDYLIFTNAGDFIPGSVEKVIMDDAPEDKYRNKFLATAMFNLGMVDTIGSGIRTMFKYQRARYFPLPEYEISNSRVKVTIIGKVLDMDYAGILARYDELTLEEIMMLDKVQKGKTLPKNEALHLRNKGLIDGRKPNYYLSLKVAQKTDQRAEYVKFKGLDKSYYLDLITKGIKTTGHLTRGDVDRLLWSKLPDRMTDAQKKAKIGNLLSELRMRNRIKNVGTSRDPRWELTG